MTPEKLAYTAGIIDGEGSIILGRNRKTDKYRSPKTSVTSCSFEILSFLLENFGGKIHTKKVYSLKHSSAWIWMIDGPKSLDFFEAILPYMVEKRKRLRAELLISEYKSLTKRNGKYSEEEKLRKLDFENRFFSF